MTPSTLFQLNFKKGDVITLTQKEDGGWWEGTLAGKTGWFPSNYVAEISQQEAEALTNAAAAGERAGGSAGGGDASGSGGGKLEFDAAAVLAKQIGYREQVVKDLIEKEKEFVADLGVVMKKYLAPMHRSDM